MHTPPGPHDKLTQSTSSRQQPKPFARFFAWFDRRNKAVQASTTTPPPTAGQIAHTAHSPTPAPSHQMTPPPTPTPVPTSIPTPAPVPTPTPKPTGTALEEQRIVKHKGTIPPFECHHCGMIWYGGASLEDKNKPSGTVLCIDCWNALDTYLYSDGPHCKSDATIRQVDFQHIATDWIADQTQQPLPRTKEKRFDRSVPRWMRRAIDLGLVQPNEKDVYIVFTTGDEPTRIDKEEADEAFSERLKRGEKPFKKQSALFWQVET